VEGSCERGNEPSGSIKRWEVLEWLHNCQLLKKGPAPWVSELVSPITLPVRRDPQHRSLLTVVSATSAPPFQPLRHQGNVGHPVVNRFTRQTLSTANRKHFFMNILRIESFCPQITHNSTLIFGSTLLMHGRHFEYWNQRLNISMRVCYLDCHKAGLCCYLVMHTENIFRPLQLFYFHLWPVYWLSFLSPRLLSHFCFLITDIQTQSCVTSWTIWSWSEFAPSFSFPPLCITPPLFPSSPPEACHSLEEEAH
jgi:hypothetical protein